MSESDGVAQPGTGRSRHITEDEYRASLPDRMAKIAGEINEGLADVLPEAMWFEWEAEPVSAAG